MRTSPQGRAFIEGFEGLYLHSYNDGCGVCTIGYGHTDAAGPPKVAYGDKITKEQADAYLAADLEKVEREVMALVKVPLTQNQFDSLVSFHFNTGALGSSSALLRLNSGNYAGVPGCLAYYDHGHVGGKLIQIAGLTRRRKAEGEMWAGSDHAPMPDMPPIAQPNPPIAQEPIPLPTQRPRESLWVTLLEAFLGSLGIHRSKP